MKTIDEIRIRAWEELRRGEPDVADLAIVLRLLDEARAPKGESLAAWADRRGRELSLMDGAEARYPAIRLTLLQALSAGRERRRCLDLDGTPAHKSPSNEGWAFAHRAMPGHAGPYHEAVARAYDELMAIERK
jgi:hypothetical protein